MPREAVVIDPAAVRALVHQWRNTARLVEQSGVCGKDCPMGGVPQAMRECAADAEKLLTERGA